MRARLAALPAKDVIGAALTGVLLLGGVLLSGQAFFGSGTDLVTMEHPLGAFATSWMKRGVLPLWDPFIAGGVPFPAATKGYFYPPFWLGLVLSDAGAIKATCVLHVALAGAGAAWLARPHVESRLASYLAGALFATSGFFVYHLYAGHLELVSASAYVPWLVGIADRVARGERVSWGASGACIGFASLTGHYQMVLIGGMAGVGFALASATARTATHAGGPRPRLHALATGAALLVAGTLVAAIQVIPTACVLPFTQRAAPEASFSSSYAAAPASFLAMLVPSLLGKETLFFSDTFAPWEACAYLGLGALALAAYALSVLPRARWLPALAMACAGALLSLGDRTPLPGWLAFVLPPLQRFRAPGRYLVFVALFVALLAGLGLDAFVASRPPKRRDLIGPLVVAGAAVLLALWLETTSSSGLAHAMAVLAPVRLADPLAWTTVLDHARDDSLLAVLALGAAVGTLVLGASPERRAAGTAVLIGLSIGDTLYAAQPFLKTAPRAALEPLAPLAPGLRRASGPEGRLLPTPELLQPNAFAAYDLAAATGYTIFLDERYARYVRRALHLPVDAFLMLAPWDGTEPLLRHLGVKVVVTTERFGRPDGSAHLAIGDVHLLGGMGSLRVLGLDAPVPRAALVHDVVVVTGEVPTYERMEEPSFDIRRTALLESAPTFSLALPPPSAHESVDIAAYEPNTVTLRVEAAAPGVVVLSDVYEPGWTATVDGVEAPLVPANRVMRAVPVGAGSHEVVMRYVPPGYRAGAWLTLLGLGVLLAFTGWDVQSARTRLRRHAGTGRVAG